MRSTDALRSIRFQFCAALLILACLLGFSQRSAAQNPYAEPQPVTDVNESEDEKRAAALKHWEEVRKRIENDPKMVAAKETLAKLNVDQLKEYRRRLSHNLGYQPTSAKDPENEGEVARLFPEGVSVDAIEKINVAVLSYELKERVARNRILEEYWNEIKEERRAKEIDRQQKEAQSGDESHEKTPTAKAVPTAADSSRATREKLASLGSVEFSNVPLKEAIDRLSKDTKIPIFLNAIEADTSALDMTVTMVLRDAPVGLILELMLSQLGLDYDVRDGVVIVSGTRQAEKSSEVRVYDVPAESARELAMLIFMCVDPMSWVANEAYPKNSGTCTAYPTGDKLIISQSTVNHRAIKKLLRELEGVSFK